MCNTWSHQGHSVSCRPMTVTFFSIFATHQLRNQAMRKLSCHPGDYRQPFKLAWTLCGYVLATLSPAEGIGQKKEVFLEIIVIADIYVV